MFRRKLKSPEPPPTPDNALSSWSYSDDLFEVWWDHGKGTAASPLTNSEGGRYLFLTFRSAEKVRDNSARADPECRYKIISAPPPPSPLTVKS